MILYDLWRLGLSIKVENEMWTGCGMMVRDSGPETGHTRLHEVDEQVQDARALFRKPAVIVLKCVFCKLNASMHDGRSASGGF